jgi:hypothetical protein
MSSMFESVRWPVPFRVGRLHRYDVARGDADSVGEGTSE